MSVHRNWINAGGTNVGMSSGHWAGVALCVLIAVLLGGCATGPRQAKLTVQIGEPVRYASASGDQFVARYGSLSDRSLHFVKVQMPGGREYTLPQVVSGSGVRYTDEREVVWWTHQGTVSVEERNADGDWEIKYSDLREVPQNN